MKLVGAPVRDIDEFESLLSGLGPGLGLIVPADSFNFANLRSIAQLVARRKAPAISVYRQFTGDGGLIPTQSTFRRSASYDDRILKGASRRRSPSAGAGQFRFCNQFEVCEVP